MITTENIGKFKFMSKKEREEAALARLQARRAEQEAKKTQAKRSYDLFLVSSSKTSNVVSSSSSMSSSLPNKDDTLGTAEPGKDDEKLEGAPRKKKRSERGGEVFRENWDASEDTSRKETDPLYMDRMQFKVLYGRGKMTGLDEQFGRVCSSRSGAEWGRNREVQVRQ